MSLTPQMNKLRMKLYADGWYTVSFHLDDPSSRGLKYSHPWKSVAELKEYLDLHCGEDYTSRPAIVKLLKNLEGTI